MATLILPELPETSRNGNAELPELPEPPIGGQGFGQDSGSK